MEAPTTPPPPNGTVHPVHRKPSGDANDLKDETSVGRPLEINRTETKPPYNLEPHQRQKFDIILRRICFQTTFPQLSKAVDQWRKDMTSCPQLVRVFSSLYEIWEYISNTINFKLHEDASYFWTVQRRVILAEFADRHLAILYAEPKSQEDKAIQKQLQHAMMKTGPSHKSARRRGQSFRGQGKSTRLGRMIMKDYISASSSRQYNLLLQEGTVYRLFREIHPGMLALFPTVGVMYFRQPVEVWVAVMERLRHECPGNLRDYAKDYYRSYQTITAARTPPKIRFSQEVCRNEDLASDLGKTAQSIIELEAQLQKELPTSSQIQLR